MYGPLIERKATQQPCLMSSKVLNIFMGFDIYANDISDTTGPKRICVYIILVQIDYFSSLLNQQ
jgi:hypothetical protein